MDWNKKNLPSGFIYMVNKKEIKAIDDLTGNRIKNVVLDGISHDESKPYKNQEFVKVVAYLIYEMHDNDFVVYIKIYGVRESNFNNNEELIAEKEKVKNKILQCIEKNIQLMQDNYPVEKMDFIYIKKS